MAGRLSTGGSQGEPVRSGSSPYFHSEVKAVELLTKNVYGVRVLPAFQRDEVARLPVSPTSFIAYRDVNTVDPSNGKPVFTDWYYSLKGYKFVGNEGRGFLSPLTAERTDRRGIDPLFDCYHLARNSKDTRPDWYALTEKAKDAKNATLEKYRVFCAMNGLVQVDNQPVNRLMYVTKASTDHLKEQLDILCSRADTPNDPDWPDFMLGDITSPYHGLWGNVQKGAFNTAGMEASLFSFSRQRDRLVNVMKFPVDPNTPWGQEVLAGRYDISDTEKVTKIATAHEILEFIVNDGFLPIDLVREACGPFWDIPEVKGRRHVGASGASPAASGGGNFAPPIPTQAAAPSPAAQAVAPVSNRKFWVSMPGGSVSPQPMPEAMVRAMVNQQRQDIQVMLESENQWKMASSFGILPPAAPAAPSAPAAPRPPAGPPAPPSVPQAPRPPMAPPAVPQQMMAPPAVPQQMMAPAPRTVAPPVPPGMAAQPPAAPPVPMQPPMAPPQPTQPPAAPPVPMQPPAAPTAPAAATAPAVPSATVVALTPQETAELQALEEEWLAVCANNQTMDGLKVQRYAELSERRSAMTAAQG